MLRNEENKVSLWRDLICREDDVICSGTMRLIRCVRNGKCQLAADSKLAIFTRNVIHVINDI